MTERQKSQDRRIAGGAKLNCIRRMFLLWNWLCVSARDTDAEIFHVFLCHNSEDKPAVREIARQLVKEGIEPWLDEEQVRPGKLWQSEIGQQIKNIKSAAIFVGTNVLGPWQDLEIQALLSQFVRRNCPVIPVVLPSAKTTPELPWTLGNLHWVDFRATDLDPLKQLIWGITGVKRRKIETPTGVKEISCEHVALLHSSWRYPKKDAEYRCPMWAFHLIVVAADEVLDRIASVEYKLHPTYGDHQRQMVTDRKSKFALKELAWGESIVQATINPKSADARKIKSIH
jgi:hypothetical protein